MCLVHRGLAKLILLGVSATVVAIGQSQTPTATVPNQAPEPEISTRVEPATFRASVNLVLVPVVVRDREGHIIGTLYEQDFQLYDKGKLQVITRFSVETRAKYANASGAVSALEQTAATPSPSEVGKLPGPFPNRFIAYVFDDVHLSFGDLARARTSAVSQLSGLLTSLTRVAVFTTSGRTRQDFTNDRDLLQTTIDRIVPVTNPRTTTARVSPSTKPT
jgi:VWFA-related protein